MWSTCWWHTSECTGARVVWAALLANRVSYSVLATYWSVRLPYFRTGDVGHTSRALTRSGRIKGAIADPACEVGCSAASQASRDQFRRTGRPPETHLGANEV